MSEAPLSSVPNPIESVAPRRFPSARVFWTAALLVLLLDIATKQLAVRYLQPPNVPHPVVDDVVRLTLAYNRGAAFSMSLGDYSRIVFGSFAAIALVVLWRLYRQSPPNDKLRVLGLGLAWGGAAGNLLDRLRGPHGVVDFIDIGVGNIRFWTFNVADSSVTIAVLLLAWVIWREDREANRAKEAARALGERTRT
jgi:signal peptidase II